MTDPFPINVWQPVRFDIDPTDAELLNYVLGGADGAYGASVYVWRPATHGGAEMVTGDRIRDKATLIRLFHEDRSRAPSSPDRTPE